MENHNIHPFFRFKILYLLLFCTSIHIVEAKLGGRGYGGRGYYGRRSGGSEDGGSGGGGGGSDTLEIIFIVLGVLGGYGLISCCIQKLCCDRERESNRYDPEQEWMPVVQKTSSLDNREESGKDPLMSSQGNFFQTNYLL